MLGLLAFILLTAFSSMPVPAWQADNQGVFFLARTDSSGDGLIDLNDENRLYYSTFAGETTAVSPAGIRVIQFAVQPNHEIVAINWLQNEQNTAAVVRVADQAIISEIELADLTNPRLTLNDSGLWVVGNNVDNVPVIRGFDPTTGALISERVMRRPDTQIEVHYSGKWMLAYHLEAGALSVLQIPGLQGVPFEVSGYAAGRPSWSPVGENVLIGTRAVNNPDDFGVLVVDLTTLTTTRHDLPDYPVGTNVDLSWSKNGQFIQIQPELSAEDTSGLPHLAFLRLSTGELQIVNSESISQVWEWTQDDRAALVTEGINISEGQQPGLVFQLYDAQENTLLPLAILENFQVFNIRWRPDGQAVAVLAQSRQTGLYGLYTFEIGASQADPQAYFETTNASISQGRLDWSGDGTRLVFFIPTEDLIFTSLGLTWAGFVVDTETQAVTRISPENSVVEMLQIYLN